MTVDEAAIAAGARLPFPYEWIWPAPRTATEQNAHPTARPLEVGGLRFDHLTIEGKRGQFVAEEADASSRGSINLSNPPSSIQLTCDAVFSRFQASQDRASEYWVAPLTNCVTACREPAESLGDHPLRPATPQPTKNEPLEPELRRLGMAGSSPTDIIRFDADGPAFVVALTDQERAREQVRRSRDGGSITALMVGAVGGRGVDIAALRRWFPFDLVEWLSVALGDRVGIPWLEFRDGEGLLVSRVHFHGGAPRYEGGRPIIDEAVHRGLGRALSLAAYSEHFRATPLRVALRAIQAVQRSAVNRDEVMLRLVVALEGLCKMLGARLSEESTALRPETAAKVKEILGQAGSELEALSTKAAVTGSVEEGEMISRLRTTVEKLERPRPGFGKAAVALLSKLDLHDADVLNPFLRDHPLLDANSLSRLLTKCRGRMAHRGYLLETSEGLSPRQAFGLLLYLQDLMLRVVFRIIKYDGHYDPPVLRHLASEPAGWVRPSTPPSYLGFV